MRQAVGLNENPLLFPRALPWAGMSEAFGLASPEPGQISKLQAAAVLAAVEGGILPPEMAPLNTELAATPARLSAWQDVPMHRDRRDARRYAFAEFS